MKVAPMLAMSLAFLVASSSASRADPLQMVMTLMDELTAKIIKEGEEEDKAYVEFVEWCDDNAKTAGFEIKSATSKIDKLEALLEELAADIEAATKKIEDLAGTIAENEKDLKDATLIFEKETADFEAAESELVETVDTLSRAIGILEKEMAKNPAAFAQIDASNFDGMLSALSIITDAASFQVADKQRLIALVQSTQNSEDDMTGAPAAKAYKSHSTGILDVLEDMKEKAEDQLSTLRMEYTKVKQNYDLLKQSLEDQIGADKKDKAEQEDAKANAEETTASSTEELSMTKKLKAETQESLATANSNCMTTAANHDASMQSRKEELKAIATAKKVLADSTGGAAEETYGFVQVSSRLHSGADLASAELVNIVKRLAKENKDNRLAQLASKITAFLHYGSATEDPFAKIKGLIVDMIAKLEKEASDAAEEKAYCDEQMSKTEAKQSELEDDVEKLTSKIDTAAAKSAQLKDDVKELQADLAALAKLQAEMDKQRADEHAVYLDAKDDLEKGLVGVRKALGVLRDYYGGSAAAASMLQEMDQQPAMPAFHGKAEGAGGSIIDILEVVESDFAKNLAGVEKTESDAQAEYDKMSQENEVSKTTKQQDVKYKTKEYVGLDKAIVDLKADLKATSAELDSVNEYYDKIKDKCVAKPESYEERQKRRANEIKGLKQALSILENETAFNQRRKRGLRGHALKA